MFSALPTVPLLSLTGITKRFGNLVANSDVSLDVRPGEIHALLGENGAGKSTLMNIAAGYARADEGRIEVRGVPQEFRLPADAIAAGIGMVHQHFHLVDRLTVAENIVLNDEPGSAVLIDYKAANGEVRDLSERMGLPVDPKALVADISVAMQQRVEILKTLYRKADVLLLDEPTAVLAPAEVRDLLTVIRSLADSGVGIVLITHKLDEATLVADRLSVLRSGEIVARFDRGDASPAELAQEMVGREIHTVVARPHAVGATVLSVTDLEVDDSRGVPALRGVSFEVGESEIVGIAGVDGNGQAELVGVLAGLVTPNSGRATVAGEPLAFEHPRSIARQGVAHVPADRRKYGLVADFTLADNFALRGYYTAPFSKRGFLQRGVIDSLCAENMAHYGVKARGVDALAKELSGGNQQKLILAREMFTSPRLLLASQPTRGLDVGSIETVHGRLLKHRDEGCGILLVSFELDEILALSTRVVVLFEGRVVLDRPRSEVSREILGAAMTGAVAA
ncbi:ABC transporter ATP-binding protein [Naasia lichenicola]|uniref:ABC transporter ATP-binding protein n=1 Tax=Naasia lichenicola TaxID=2565933 RepID=A0A4S4FIZ9_9MICO|nr:ABC transporter ATP-binding protein [Naasia lichenicola]THG30081.1 ABC transporter ATP-binding protein [Naasia lichenicola]